MLKEWCPQCKAPFSYLFTHRHLDGAPSDYPLEESVTLLKRARWFVDEHEARERAKVAEGGGRRVTADDARDDTERYHGVERGPDGATGAGGRLQRLCCCGAAGFAVQQSSNSAGGNFLTTPSFSSLP